jgi:hypothetical protein
MVNPSKIKIGYSNVNSLLDEFGIEYTKNKTKPINLDPLKVESHFFNKLRRGLYAEGYNECRDRYDYDYLLTDGDILLFEMWQDDKNHVNKLFYLYLESPYQISSYYEYLTHCGLPYSEVGDKLYEEYSIEIDSLPKRKDSLKIHYDYYPKDYLELAHPASHIHIGHKDDTRIPVNGILSPFEFICFCLKIIKYDRWKNAITTPSFSDLVLSQKSNITTLDKTFFSTNDECEFYFS